MGKYALKPFTADEFQRAKGGWEAIAGGDAFDVEFAQFFTWVETHLAPKQNDSMALQLANTDAGGRVDAIVEVIDSRGGALSKLLRVVVSPQYWDVSNSREAIIELYTEVFVNFFVHGALGARQKVFKLYGRDDDMMSILRSLHSHWAVPGTSADFEGRFLTITVTH